LNTDRARRDKCHRWLYMVLFLYDFRSLNLFSA
jgi:hypothetical protein